MNITQLLNSAEGKTLEFKRDLSSMKRNRSRVHGFTVQRFRVHRKSEPGLFVCMPFHDSFDRKFKDTICVAAKKAGFDKPERVEVQRTLRIRYCNCYRCLGYTVE